MSSDPLVVSFVTENVITRDINEKTIRALKAEAHDESLSNVSTGRFLLTQEQYHSK